MGNCCKTASSEEWGGEDWGSLTSNNDDKKIKNITYKKRISSRKVFDDLISASSSDHGNGKIKIKITKRELEVLLGEIEKQKQKQHGKVLFAEQVLVRLMNNNTRQHHHPPNYRAWSPVLETIPELN